MAKKKILLVEDEPFIADMVKRRLEANNYEIITAYDGQEGLEKARKENPDLIILDLMLPKIGGYKICRILKFDEKYKKVPIIMLTALTQEKDKELGYGTGADAYITKPFESTVLLAKIEELLKKGELT